VADYDAIRTRFLPGIKEALTDNSKYLVVTEERDQRGNEYIEITLESVSNEPGSNGCTSYLATFNLDFHANEAKADLRHDIDRIMDVLMRNDYHRDDSGNHQYFGGHFTGGPEFSDDEDWAFRLTYEATHTKVY